MRDGARVGNLPRMTLDDLLAKYDRRVPRYTSYPTAPHFMAMAEDAPYRAWLAQLESGTKLSLYLHVPFCASLCLFCGCNTTVARQDQPLRGYTQTLLQEIDLIADAIGQRLPVAHVHWGGGTPTVLPPDCMVAISDKLRSRSAPTFRWRARRHPHHGCPSRQPRGAGFRSGRAKSHRARTIV